MDELLENIDEIVRIIEEMLQEGEEIPPGLEEELASIINSISDEIESTEIPTQLAPPRGAELLWILAGGDPEAFAQYLQTIPDPAMNALARDPYRLGAAIDQFQTQVTLPAGESDEGIAQAGLTSSNIYGFQYNPRTKKLFVKFNGRNAREGGPIYEYEGVQPAVFKIFQNGAVPARTNGQNRFGRWWVGKQPSLGASFYSLIRQGGYPYQRVG